MVRKIVGGIVALWVLMMVLGIEVLTGTEHSESYSYGMADRHYVPERYTCTYWTGTGTWFQEESPYGFSSCPVWRWGRQVAD
jgi:hypothetical protein